jgi:HAMP domain-containing protein
MSGKRPASLTFWMTASVAVFVLLGSLALVLVFERHFVREERRAFENLANANAGFLEHTKLPQSARMAEQLGEIIGARVFFVKSGADPAIGKPGDSLDPAALALPFDGRARALPNGEWMIGFPGRDGARVVFVRPASDRLLAVGSTDMWLALGAFWALSLALGCGLARRVTRPLRKMADSLPRVGTEQALPDLPVGRRDEIGQLAQTLTRTHESLLRERERRRAAERHALLGRMAASLAHEVRNPVAAIRLHAQLLEQAGPDEAAVSRRLIESEAGQDRGTRRPMAEPCQTGPADALGAGSGGVVRGGAPDRAAGPPCRECGSTIECGYRAAGDHPADRHRHAAGFRKPAAQRGAGDAHPAAASVR